MKLTYQTATATLIQFVVLSFLGIANAINSIFFTCRNPEANCTNNLLTSIIFFILTAGWFGLIWVLGYTAQERRSKKLALILIGAEAFIALIAYFNARHYNDYLGLATSLIDMALAIWIITLAFRLFRSGSGRITTTRTRHRRKQHRTTNP